MNLTKLSLIGVGLLLAVKNLVAKIPGTPKKSYPKAVEDWRAFAERFADSGITANVILAIIEIESAGNPEAVGSVGEIGLMQVTYPAYLDVVDCLGLTYSYETLEGNPDRQIEVGAGYLKLQFAYFQDLSLAVKAYNTGRGGIESVAAMQYWNRFKDAYIGG